MLDKNKQYILLLLLFLMVLVSGCGSRDPRYELHFGLDEVMPTNTSKVILADSLDNSSSFLSGKWYLKSSLANDVHKWFPEGLVFSVIVNPYDDVVYVDFYVKTDDFEVVLVLNRLSRQLRNYSMESGVYHREYVPYMLYMYIPPYDDKVYAIVKPERINNKCAQVP